MSDKETRGETGEAAVDPVVRAVGGELRAELRAAKDEIVAELRRPPRPRTARLYAAAGAAALYAGGALTALLVLLFDLAVPGWVAALVVTVLLGGLAVALRSLAREDLRGGDGAAKPRETAEAE